jgi:hypothetical protein
MKTRTTRLALSHSEGIFEVEIVDEGTGEYVMVSCGLDRAPFEQHISVSPSEWPFLRDAIDRMFVEIAEAQVEPESKAPQGAEDGWIPWDGGECPKDLEDKLVRIRLRHDRLRHDSCLAHTSKPQPASVWWWNWTGGDGDIIAYKVVG